MKTLISPSQLRRIVMVAALSMLALVLSGCNFHPLNPVTEPTVREPLKIVKEIPAGYPGEGTIVKTTTLFTPGVDVRYEYPNGYVSVGQKLDPEWRKKKPKKESEQSVDSFNFSGQSGSSGRTSGSVIRTF